MHIDFANSWIVHKTHCHRVINIRVVLKYSRKQNVFRTRDMNYGKSRGSSHMECRSALLLESAFSIFITITSRYYNSPHREYYIFTVICGKYFVYDTFEFMWHTFRRKEISSRHFLDASIIMCSIKAWQDIFFYNMFTNVFPLFYFPDSV